MWRRAPADTRIIQRRASGAKAPSADPERTGLPPARRVDADLIAVFAGFRRHCSRLIRQSLIFCSRLHRLLDFWIDDLDLGGVMELLQSLLCLLRYELAGDGVLDLIEGQQRTGPLFLDLNDVPAEL